MNPKISKYEQQYLLMLIYKEIWLVPKFLQSVILQQYLFM